MPHFNRREIIAALGALGATCAPGVAFHASAQEVYPSRAVKLILPVVAGNGSDVFARALGKELAALSGQAFVIDNRPGGNAVIAARVVMQSPPDGYTFLVGSNASHAANMATLKDPGFDPTSDFTPVALVVKARPLLVVSAESPYRSIEQLVQAGRQDPALLSAACGSVAHQMLVAMFARSAGVQVRIIPYKGTPQAIQDTVGHLVSFMIADAPTLVPMVQGGRLRPLAVTSDERLSSLAEVPTLRDRGLATIPLYSWAALYAPARTPPSVVQRMAQLAEQALRSEGLRQFAAEQRVDLSYLGPAALAAFQKEQIAAYRDAAALAGVEPQ